MTDEELIRPKRQDTRRLRVGQLIRLDPEETAPVYEVERVTDCSATIRLRHAKPKLIEIPGREPFEAIRGERIQIAPTAFVFPVVE